MKKYSTRQAAKQLGISFPTLNRYIGEGKIPVPPVMKIGGMGGTIWTRGNIETVRQLLPKIANGRKTRYKKHSAVSTQQSAKTKKKTQTRVPAPHKKRKPKKK